MPDLSDTDLAPRPATPPATPVSPSRFLCPYCGHIGDDAVRCGECRGLFEPLSRQATQNAMGPWQVRDGDQPHRPGCSLDTLRRMVERGKIGPNTVLRGPTTRQFWNFARNTPGVAVLLGECHACHHAVDPEEYLCAACGATLHPTTDRQTLGLAPVKLLPGAAAARDIAASSFMTRPSPSSAPIAEPRPSRPPEPPAPPLPVRSRSTRPESPAEATGASQRTTRRLQSSLTRMTWAFGAALVVNAATMAILAFVLLGPPLGPGSGSTPAAAPPQAITPTRPTGESEAPIPTDAALEAPTEPLPLDPPPADSPLLQPDGGRVTRPDAGQPAAAPPPTEDGAALHAELTPWLAQIEEATELLTSSTMADVERAVGLLQGVLDAAAAEAGVDPSAARERYPILGARLGAAEQRLERLRRRDPF
jgi:hypothetical protein